MSNTALTWAFKQNMKSGPKFVLVALCDYADEAGSCYPKIAQLAVRTGQDARTVQRHLKSLTADNFITRKRKRYDDGRLAGYRFHINMTKCRVDETTRQKQQDHTTKTAPLGDKNCANHTTDCRDNNPQDNHHFNHHHDDEDEKISFEEFWDSYPLTEGQRRNSCTDIWEGLTDKQKRACLASLPKYAEIVAESDGYGWQPRTFLKDKIFNTFEAVQPPKPIAIPDEGTPGRKIYDAAIKTHGFDVWRSWFSGLEISGRTIYPTSKFKSDRILKDYPNVLAAAGFTLGEPKEASA